MTNEDLYEAIMGQRSDLAKLSDSFTDQRSDIAKLSEGFTAHREAQ
jgi:hypothetical protein